MKVCKPIIFKNSDFSRDSVATYWGADQLLHVALANFLRYGYDPSSGVPVGTIIEDEATNVFTKSNDFDDDIWIKDNFNEVTITTSAEIAPDGSFAQLMSADFSPARIERLSLITGTATYSIHVKKKSGAGMFTMSGCGSGIFNLATGTIFASDGAAIQQLNNDWYRCSITGGSTSGVTNITMSTTGGAFEYYIFGAQLETGSLITSVATSFIYTDEDPETRAADEFDTAPPRLVSSNVTESDAPEWDPDETYTAGELCMVLGNYHHVYRSVGTNTDTFPPDNLDGEWVDEGATNRWRMFDVTVGAAKQTISSDEDNLIHVALDVDQAVTSITLLNIEGLNVRVTVASYAGVLLYEHYENLLTSSYESNWWSFFFSTRKSTNTITLTDLPSFRPVIIDVYLDGGDLPAKLGKLIVGEGIDIGCAMYGTDVGILDFSLKKRDDFGNSSILQRPYSASSKYPVRVLNGQMDYVYDLLASLRATPAVYIGYQNYKCTIVFGFPTAWNIVIPGHKYSDLSLQIEGL